MSQADFEAVKEIGGAHAYRLIVSEPASHQLGQWREVRMSAMLDFEQLQLRFVDHVQRRGGRALILAHRDELIQQALDKLHLVDPSLPLGVVQAARDELPPRSWWPVCRP